MAKYKKTRTVSASNQFTDAAELQGYFNVSVSGTFTATITAQRSFDGGSTWHDVQAWTDITEEYGFEPEDGVQYRIGAKDGDYTVGSPVLRISK